MARVIYDERVHWAEEHADTGDGNSAADEGRDEPDDYLQAVEVRKKGGGQLASLIASLMECILALWLRCRRERSSGAPRPKGRNGISACLTK